MSICSHHGRAIGPHFERCLLCGCWRLGESGTWQGADELMPIYIEAADIPREVAQVRPCGLMMRRLTF